MTKLQSDSEASPPKRRDLADELGKPHIQTGARRFRWRAVIHSGRKLDAASGQPTVAWHLAECATPADVSAHCTIGQHLIGVDGNPDGHCQIDGVCLRCPEVAAEAATPATAN